MNVILSIKPKYVQRIISKEKLFEFRKAIFKSVDHPSRVYIYSSDPVKKIVGYFTISEIIKDHPRQLWYKCKHASGIPEEDFFEYFFQKQEGYAIAINEVTVFDNPLEPTEMIKNFTPPQSFAYVNG